jgi:hypothetical protein
MGETAHERRMRLARESLAKQPRVVTESTGDAEPSPDAKPAPATTPRAEAVEQEFRDSSGEEDRYQRFQFISPVGCHGIYGDRKTRKRQEVMWRLPKVVDQALRRLDEPMTVEQLLADPFFREVAETAGRNRTLWGIELTTAKVAEACAELVETGQITAVATSPPSFAAVWPQMDINDSTAFEEVLALVNEVESLDLLKEGIDEIRARIYPPVRPIEWKS